MESRGWGYDLRVPKRTRGSVHVATIKTKYKDREYVSHVLRRSYREDGKVKHENLGNLSHLPPESIEVLRRSLAGETLVAAGDRFEIVRSLPHGHVAAVLGVLRDLDLERLLCRERSHERDLCVAMIVQRVIGAGSKLSATRRFAQSTLAAQLDLGEVKEAELLAAMDWLLERQERVEKALARRHLAGEGFVLFDLSSSYLEGRHCELGALGYSRDGKRGKLQITYGLCCSPEGRPVSVEVHPGNTADPSSLASAVARVKDRFGIDRVVFVGDRGMITEARVRALKELEVGFITSLRAPQIQALTVAPDFQLSLFDEQGVCEITCPQHPGERLVVCRNPAVATERARKREALLTVTEGDLEQVKRMVDGPRGTLRDANAGKIGQRVGRVINQRKMAKHFTLQIAEGTFTYTRNRAKIDEEALLDGIYVIRTSEPAATIGTAAVVRAYKTLKVNERAFKQMKAPELQIRPVHHRLQDRVRAHVFLCMLAYHVQYELTRRLEPLLFTDDTPLAPVDPVAPAKRSPAANRKAASARTADGHAAHTLPDLLADLATLCRNTVRVSATDSTYQQLTTPTALQTRAFELLATTPK